MVMCPKLTILLSVLVDLVVIVRSNSIINNYYYYDCYKETCNCCYGTINKLTPSFNGINNGTRYLNFFRNMSFNLMSFQQFQIKIIETFDQLIFYQCSNRNAYFRVQKYNYYPLQIDFLTFTKPLNIITVSKVDEHFQKCLRSFCFFENRTYSNLFSCENSAVKKLNFNFQNFVTSKCLLNMTSVVIKSYNLRNINNAVFFRYALNLVYVYLDTNINLKTVSCHTFQNLKFLRVLYVRQIQFDDLVCIVKQHVDIVKASSGSVTVWNLCDGKFELNNGTNTYVLNNVMDTRGTVTYVRPSRIGGYVIIVLTLFAVVSIIILVSYFCQTRTVRRPHCTTSTSIEFITFK